MLNQRKSALFAAQSMFQNQHIKINAKVVTQTAICNMELFQAGKIQQKNSGLRLI
jgi:hypothetical protein